MKINETTRIIGQKVILVPYREYHVLRYHEWMKSSELQQLTASEPLSIKEEYAMQKSWRDDEDKCTFIILNKEIYDNECNEIESMIGDTNLFFNNVDNLQEAEVEIMIAEASNRGKGFGMEAIVLMLRYGIDKLKVSNYQVKIGEQNIKSIQLFTKLGFQEIKRNDIFKEVTLSKAVDDTWLQYLAMKSFNYIIDENYK